MKNIKSYTFLLFILFMCAANAQNDDSTKSKHHFFDKHFFSSEGKSPTIIIDYGLSKVSRDKFNGTFANPNLIELKLGYLQTHMVSAVHEVYSQDMQDLFGGNISTKLSGNSGLDQLRTDTWRFGINRMQGYGYSFGDSKLMFNTEYSFIWSSIEFLDEPSDSAAKNIADMYNKKFKFGTSAAANIQLNFTPNIGINAAYERAIVFQKHLVWKWLGSQIIELASTFALNNFTDDLIDRAPAVAPIANFVLKSALYYGLYELRHKKMNWPFQTEAPISFDQFKFGFVFSF